MRLGSEEFLVNFLVRVPLDENIAVYQSRQ